MAIVKKLILLLLGAVLLPGCDKIEYSPNQRFDSNSPVDLNQKNIGKLLSSKDQDDTLRFILSGDSQRHYDNSADFVEAVNKMKGIDFVILDGDISDFGLLQEMEWVNQIYSKLKVPYIGVIGNHDLQAKGSDVFQHMYGKLNYSFVYDSIKFVCHDTNSREYNFDGATPDLPWLRNEFKPDSKIKAFISVAHVPPFINDFDPGMESEYLSILTSVNLLGSLYAHINHAGIYYYSSINDVTPDFKDELIQNEGFPPFIVTNAIEERGFRVIEIINGQLHAKNVNY
jgi:Icc protein